MLRSMKKGRQISGPSRNGRRGRLGSANSGHKALGAALERVLPNCSDTSLQCFSRHWITSFQLLKSQRHGGTAIADDKDFFVLYANF